MKYIGHKNSKAAIISSILLSAVVCLFTSLTYAQSSSRNLIQNPSFEDKHKGWQQTEPVSISDHFHFGTKSSKISSKHGAITQIVSVTPNTDYILEGYVKGSGTIGAKVKRKRFKDQVTGASDWIKVTVEFNSGSSSTVDVYASFYKEQGRFDDFKLTPKGSAQPSYSSTPPTQCPGMGDLPIASVFDDGNDGNPAINSIDGDLTNRWSSKGMGKTITYVLDRNAEVRQLDVMWYKGHERVILFSVETSLDGQNWSMVLSNASSTPSPNFDTYNIENLLSPEAKFVRIVGKGNSGSDWNSIVELKVKGCVS